MTGGIDEAFRALADPSRRRLLDSLRARNGQTLRELCAGLDMTRQSVSKHLAILEAANLVTTRRRGREKLHFLNAAPIAEIGERWINHYERPRVEALSDLKRALEGDAVPDPQFVYTTYIHTTPEQLWRALTEPAFTRRYWYGIAFESDWKAGSPVTLHFEERGLEIADPEQVVLESDPPRRLSYTWHSFTPEWAAAHGYDDEHLRRLTSEPRSRVTFEIEPAGEQVRLTVIHDDLEPGGLVLESIRMGWPLVLSGLKTLLEHDDG
jgi:DNA-binding transcriptional ArsR family regulator/uncharacterized protein YndB with AHSA1/START domain